jgi:hypothetical protein
VVAVGVAVVVMVVVMVVVGVVVVVVVVVVMVVVGVSVVVVVVIVVTVSVVVVAVVAAVSIPTEEVTMNFVEIHGRIERKGVAAFLIATDIGEVWIPFSQISEDSMSDPDMGIGFEGDIEIAEWLAIDRGLC